MAQKTRTPRKPWGRARRSTSQSIDRNDSGNNTSGKILPPQAAPRVIPIGDLLAEWMAPPCASQD
jgi:hypothetical protein